MFNYPTRQGSRALDSFSNGFTMFTRVQKLENNLADGEIMKIPFVVFLFSSDECVSTAHREPPWDATYNRVDGATA